MPAPSVTLLRFLALIALLVCLGVGLSGCINASTTNPPATAPTPDNGSDQDPTPEPEPEPTPPPAPAPEPSGPTSGLKSISAGANHNCAITHGDDDLWCWGANGSGQLGDKSIIDSSTFKRIGDAAWAWTLVAAGADHSCAIKSDGTLWCWGANASGQLGIGNTAARNQPVQIGNAANWQTAAVGTDHSCAIKGDGTLWCWGDNTQSQLGDGTTDQSTSPKPIGSDTDWSALNLGTQAGCAIKTDKSLWCWGDNASGQLGLGNTTDAATPTQVQPGTAWTGAAVGVNHSCGIRDDDASLWCWGDNAYGQLGQGNANPSSSPLQVQPGTRWIAVASGNGHSCAIKDDATLWCWGNNTAGQLGLGTAGHLAIPKQVSHSKDWRAVSTGDYHSCAVDADYIGYCWGLNDAGQLGSGNPLGTNTPRQFDDSDTWQTIDSGAQHSCGLKSVPGSATLKTLWCGGGNGYGQLGISSIANQAAPVQVKGPSGVLEYWESFSTGHDYSCAITDDAAELYCWGRNDLGQLGRGTVSGNVAANWSLQAKVTQGTDDWVKAVAGATHTCGIKNTDELWCWGDNSTGQLGDGTTTDSANPIQVFEDAAATIPFTALDVAVGGYYNGTITAGGHTCAIKTGGTLWCWGKNDVSQLGDGTTTNRTEPTQIGADTDWVSVKAGNRYTCAEKSDGALYCWGDNSAGQIGTNSPPDNPVTAPKEVAAGTIWRDYDLGQQSACAVTSDNGLECWGDNNQNQLTSQVATDDNGYVFSPQDASSNTDWQAVAMGKTHGCGIRADSTTGRRTAWCWGEGAEYQFGDGSAWRTTPQRLSLE